MTSAGTFAITSGDALRARIRELATTEADPARITDMILRSLSADEAAVVAAVTLHNYVRTVVIQAPHMAPTKTYETSTGGKTLSPKVARARDWVELHLSRSICIDESERVWRHLGDLTQDDCTHAATLRRGKAAATLNEAERFEKIAATLDEHSAATVRELPRDVLESVLR